METPAGFYPWSIKKNPLETPSLKLSKRKITEVKPEAAAEKFHRLKKKSDASFDKVDNDWKQERPDILAKLRKEGKIKEGETSIPRAEYMELWTKDSTSDSKKGELAEAVLYRMAMENKFLRGMASMR